MPRTTRTFIALPIPNPLKTKLERLQRLIAPSLEGARWVEPSGFHLTLAFLGDVDDTDLSKVCNAVTVAVAAAAPFHLTIKSLGTFPTPVKPRVVWVGIEGDLDALADLQKIVAVAATEAGYRPEDERFHPHIALGRLKVGRGPTIDATALEAHYRLWAAGVFTAETVVVYASTSTPEGPAYAPLGQAPIGVRPRRNRP